MCDKRECEYCRKQTLYNARICRSCKIAGIFPSCSHCHKRQAPRQCGGYCSTCQSLYQKYLRGTAEWTYVHKKR